MDEIFLSIAQTIGILYQRLPCQTQVLTGKWLAAFISNDCINNVAIQVKMVIAEKDSEPFGF